MPEADEILALADAYREAVRAKDPERLAALYDADVRVFDTWGDRPFEGLAAWRVNLDGWLTSLGDDESVEVSFGGVRISSHGEMGCLHALVTYRALNAAGEVVRWMDNRLSWVVVRSQHGWTIAHEHTSVPIGPDLQGVLQPA